MKPRELDHLLGRLRARDEGAPTHLPDAVAARIASPPSREPSQLALVAAVCMVTALLAAAISHDVASRRLADQPPQLDLFSPGLGPVTEP